MFNYRTICQSNLLKDLPDKHKEIIIRRFGLEGDRETLESIGRDLGVTRERIRQIERDGLKRLEEKIETPLFRNIFQNFLSYFKKNGGLKKEEILLEQLGRDQFKNHVFFLLALGSLTSLGKSFERVPEDDVFHTLWTIDKNSPPKAQKAINNFIAELKKKKQPLTPPAYVLPAYLEVSKIVLKGPQGLYGLKEWPEINPRGIKDRAYLAFKEEKKPLHFSEVASLIKASVAQTVHNELIKDPRFVLVGRGLYALQEWGYSPGTVREVIAGVLRESKRPLSQEEVLRKVLKQRQVQPNTVLLNLQNKKYFVKKSPGYTVRKV